MIKKLGAALHMGDTFVSSLDEARKLKKSSKDKKKKRSGIISCYCRFGGFDLYSYYSTYLI